MEGGQVRLAQGIRAIGTQGSQLGSAQEAMGTLDFQYVSTVCKEQTGETQTLMLFIDTKEQRAREQTTHVGWPFKSNANYNHFSDPFMICHLYIGTYNY